MGTRASPSSGRGATLGRLLDGESRMVMDLSGNSNSDQRFYAVKLEHELERSIQAHKFDEALWGEKEASLNGIISEQKKVISLLESVLKNNQQLLDSLQQRLVDGSRESEQIESEIEEKLLHTFSQIEILKQNLQNSEKIIRDKISEIQVYQKNERALVQELESLRSQVKEKSTEYNTLLQKYRDVERFAEETEKSQQLIREQLKGSEVAISNYKKDYDEVQLLLSEAYRKSQIEIGKLEKETDSLKSEFEIELTKSNQIILSLQKDIESNRVSFQRGLEEKDRALAVFAKKIDEHQVLALEERTELNALVSSWKAKYEDTQSQLCMEQAGSLHQKKSNDDLSEQLRNTVASLGTANKNLLDAQNNSNLLQKNLQDLLDKQSKYEINIKGLAAREKRYRRNIEILNNKLEEEKERLYHTISFQLGYALLQGCKSFNGFLRLPKELYRIRAEAKRRKLEKRNKREIVFSSASSPIVEGNKQNAEQLVLQQESRDLPILNVSPTPKVKLKVAAIMDEFTYHSYSPEADVMQLHPETWLEQLEEFRPDLLFIESAWNGLDGLWKGRVSNADDVTLGVIDWCKNNSVRSLFWNKEDPVHFSTFIPIASRVDVVFTTDVDCLPKYKSKIGHDRVYLLPFAAQPAIHNPIEKYERKDAFNFAGSYYLRYPERQRDFASLIDTVSQFKPVDIYDRNFDNPHPHYIFPEKYKSHILGKLPFNEIDKAYKGYRYGINMNTIKQSQTMFARRVFELLASNTVVVSNFSRGVRTLFGDLVISSDMGTELSARLDSICRDELMFRKFRLLGLRKVMRSHTYGTRLAYIQKKLFQDEVPVQNDTKVYAIARVSDQKQLLNFIETVSRQSYSNVEMIAVSESELVSVTPAVTIVKNADDLIGVLNLAESTSFLAFFSNDDYYGVNYILDLVLADRYSKAKAYGKRALYRQTSAGAELINDGEQYKPTTTLAVRSSLIRASEFSTQQVRDVIESINNSVFSDDNLLAIDEFNYCQDVLSDDNGDYKSKVGDLNISSQGIPEPDALSEIVGNVQFEDKSESTTLPELSAAEISKSIPKSNSKEVLWSLKKDVFHVKSTLPIDKHMYIYSRKIYSRSEINMVLNSQFKLDCETTAQLKTVFEFQDVNGKKLAHAMNHAGDFNALAIPENCTRIRFGIRIQGPGEIKIKRLILGNFGQKPVAVVGSSPYLILTKQYPSYDDLYKYGFLHTRVRSYKEHNLNVDVFRITNEDGNSYREFENIDIVSGDADLLDATLSTGQYKNVLVHLLDEKMWSVLSKHVNNVRVTVWVHGAEIQLWQRRQFEFERMSADEVKRQKRLSDKRLKFWKSILNDPHPNLKLVFVSQYFAEEVAADFGIDLSKVKYEIVHNYIDSNIFPYVAKDKEQRTRLLSIRPYASRKYANDLTVKAIVELSKRPFFKDLEICLVGDGELFQETTAPLAGFPNVTLDRRFLSHREISEKHKQYGVFLTPTRMDSQGVSRDEAMSSGLVPVTTNVTAIPEFVDDDCGILVDGEDFIGMANAIEKLYHNPDLFLRLSSNAAQRVRRQCGLGSTISKEIDIIENL